MNLSIVVTGRNDNYDGDFNDRLSLAINRNLKSLPDAEFIFVEWNPYMDRPLVCEELQKIFKDRIKYYAVHPKFHEAYCTFDEFNEYPAKNVGIRRAKGKFIACVNSDIIFDPQLVENLRRVSETNIVYRASRIDIRPDYKYVRFPLLPKFILGRYTGPTDACGDFTMTDRDTWVRFTGYCEEFPEQRLHKDSLMVHLFTSDGLPIRMIGSATHWRHPSSWANGFRRPKVGDTKWDFRKSGYKRNKFTWGLANADEVERNGIIWLE